MELKFGRSLWSRQNQRPPHYPKLRGNLSCDVAIIGGGISGALVAHELVRHGMDVAVIDRRTPGTGSTSASSALLLYETDSSLAELARRHGRPAAIRVYALGRRAIREIGAIARTLRIDCGFSARKSLYLASDAEGWRSVRMEYQLRRRAGFAVRLLPRARLKAEFGLDGFGAICSPGAAQFDVVRFAQAVLFHHARRRALRVFEAEQVEDVKSGPAGVTLRTRSGRRIEARQVVVATGYEAAPLLPAGLVRLHSSYVIASQPIPAGAPWKNNCLIWETARPYLYLRTTADRRVMVGGEDEPFADPRRRDAKLAAKARSLARRFRRMFPRVDFTTALAWTGTFGETADGLPYIGARDSAPRIFYALGYGGNGITFSQIAAKILGRLCRGRKHRDAALFRFDRPNNGKSGTVSGQSQQ